MNVAASYRYLCAVSTGTYALYLRVCVCVCASQFTKGRHDDACGTELVATEHFDLENIPQYLVKIHKRPRMRRMV